MRDIAKKKVQAFNTYVENRIKEFTEQYTVENDKDWRTTFKMKTDADYSLEVIVFNDGGASLSAYSRFTDKEKPLSNAINPYSGKFNCHTGERILNDACKTKIDGWLIEAMQIV